jgi:hypothetical protein
MRRVLFISALALFSCVSDGDTSSTPDSLQRNDNTRNVTMGSDSISGTGPDTSTIRRDGIMNDSINLP